MSDDPKDPAITFEVLTLFPEMLAGFVGSGVLGKAAAAGLLAVHCTNPRDFARDKHRSVDDTPYGGGPGMVLRVDVLAAALAEVRQRRGPTHTILLTPQGRVLNQAKVEELARRPRIALLCGRYEGIDDRVRTQLADEQISVGDYVLAGGEIAAAAIIEAVARLIPGVLGCGLSSVDESFAAGRLEYPQWTRPAEFGGEKVPDILSSGDHAAVARWRRRAALRRTREWRPDLFSAHPLTPEELALLDDGNDDDGK